MNEIQKQELEASIVKFNICRDSLQIRSYAGNIYIRYPSREHGIVYDGFDKEGNLPIDLLEVSRHWEKDIQKQEDKFYKVGSATKMEHVVLAKTGDEALELARQFDKNFSSFQVYDCRHDGNIENFTRLYLHKQSSNGFSVSVVTDYEVPKEGDTINVFGTPITLTEDMKVGIELQWNDKKQCNEPFPRMTNFKKNNVPVFYANGFSWRITDK